MPTFEDRRDAGRKLADRFERYVGQRDVVVLGLPRGGVPVAYEIAKRIGAPLDVLIVRKIGVPGHPELAMGAIASGGIRVVDRHVIDALGVSAHEFESIEQQERAELARRERTFRSGRAPLEVARKTVVLVDDGLATGASMVAAIEALRTRRPERIVAAVPVAPPETCAALRERTDEMICLVTPARLVAVGLWYQDFEQTTDREVRELLDAAARELPARSAKSAPHAVVPPR